MSTYVEGPRHAQITSTDHGPIVNVAAWILMATTILFTLFRMVSNFVLRGVVSLDDAIIALATFVSIGQSVASTWTVRNGLGQHQDTLSPGMLDGYQKSMLASQVLYVSTLALSKFSLLFLLSRLISTPQKAFRIVLRASWAIMLVYFLAEVLALSFQCTLPNTWDTIDGKCMNMTAFWNFDAFFDVASCLALLILPVMIIWPLKMRTGRKIAAASPFYFQIPACAFVLVRIVHVHSLYNSADQTWAATSYQIWTSVNVHFSVIIANLPCIKVFLDGFNSSLWKGENFVSSGFTQADSSQEKSGRRISTKPKGFSKLGEEEEDEREEARWEYDYRPDKTHTTVTVVSQPSDSRSLSDDGAIGKTTEWSVEHMPTERLVPRDYSRSLHDHTSGR